ncbi:MAG: nitronate monooxygenase [Alphaproteobacteria bacterium]
MWESNPLTQALDLKYPIFQAPMAGGATTPDLVAAVSSAGALGWLGAGYMSADAIREAIAAIRTKTQQPFGVNLFVPETKTTGAPLGEAAAALEPYRRALGLAPQTLPIKFAESFTEQIAVVFEAQPAAFGFTFGIPPQNILHEMRQRKIKIFGTATTVHEAIALTQAGVDVIVAQGAEAGAHRGTFAVPYDVGLVGLMALVPQICAATPLSVVAAGGIMDGQGIAAALSLGASGAMLGTAFLGCPEAGISDAYRKALRQGRDDATAITAVFSGKPARGLRNRFMAEMVSAPLAPYPQQNTLTRDLRAAAAKAGNPDFLSLWAGQGVGLIRRLPAKDLVAQLALETTATFRKFVKIDDS